MRTVVLLLTVLTSAATAGLAARLLHDEPDELWAAASAIASMAAAASALMIALYQDFRSGQVERSRGRLVAARIINPLQRLEEDLTRSHQSIRGAADIRADDSSILFDGTFDFLRHELIRLRSDDLLVLNPIPSAALKLSRALSIIDVIRHKHDEIRASLEPWIDARSRAEREEVVSWFEGQIIQALKFVHEVRVICESAVGTEMNMFDYRAALRESARDKDLPPLPRVEISRHSKRRKDDHRSDES